MAGPFETDCLTGDRRRHDWRKSLDGMKRPVTVCWKCGLVRKDSDEPELD